MRFEVPKRNGIRRHLSVLLIPIPQDNLVNDFTADNTSPSEKVSILAIEFFVIHEAIASMAFHNSLLSVLFQGFVKGTHLILSISEELL